MSQRHGDLCSCIGKRAMHAVANIGKAPWRAEATRGFRTSMQQTFLRCIRPVGAMVRPSLYEGFGLLVEAVHYSLKSLL
jgi:hypothetical protein